MNFLTDPFEIFNHLGSHLHICFRLARYLFCDFCESINSTYSHLTESEQTPIFEILCRTKWQKHFMVVKNFLLSHNSMDCRGCDLKDQRSSYIFQMKDI